MIILHISPIKVLEEMDNRKMIMIILTPKNNGNPHVDLHRLKLTLRTDPKLYTTGRLCTSYRTQP